jgi:DNA-binding PadR family transcriptional regulator
MTASTRNARHLPAFILLALAHGPVHGNAIRAELAARMPGFKVDSGAIYRALHALEEAGDVTCQWDTGTRGPARKVYRITEGGWASLDEWEADIRRRLGFLQSFLAALGQVRMNPGGRG